MRREEQFKTLITTHMSPELQGIVTSHCYGRYLENIPFFKFQYKHLRGIQFLRAEEEKQMFTTQVGTTAAAGAHACGARSGRVTPAQPLVRTRRPAHAVCVPLSPTPPPPVTDRTACGGRVLRPQ
jgi:hypothetical protein